MTKNRFPASRFLVQRMLPALAVAAFTSAVTVPAFAADAVVLYTADGLENLYKDVLPAFEKKEGVKVNIVTAGSGEVVNRATVAFRNAALTLLRSQSYLGAQYRRLRTRLGAPKAITAMARKLACLFYKLIKHGQPYVDNGDRGI